MSADDARTAVQWLWATGAIQQLAEETVAPAVAAAVADALRDAELTRLRAELERARAATAEAIIRDCIPGGSICDPQQVADAIRAWAQEPPA